MAKWIQKAQRHLWSAWMSIQVEFQGSYSMERLQRLDNYMRGLSSKRLVLICLLTPLPSLVLSLLNEVPPLAPLEADVYENWVFFVRGWAVIIYVGGFVLLQMGQGVSRLKLNARQIGFITILAGAISIGIFFAVCALIVFPVPFGLLVVAPPNACVITLCFAYILRSHWRADPSLWSDIKRQLAVYQCQVTLTFVYPLYVYGFVSLSGMKQAVFVMVLPIIKLSAKNWVSRALGNHHDLKPETVIFTVEIFNSLYVSSWTSTAIIMEVDLIHFWVSISDVIEVLKGVKVLMDKIPRDHPIALEDFLQVALRILAVDNKHMERDPEDSMGMSPVTPLSDVLESFGSVTNLSSGTKSAASNAVHIQHNTKATAFHDVKVVPISIQQEQYSESKQISTRIQEPTPTPTATIETIFTRAERASFIQKTTHALFITEYIVLVEYVEVVLPIIYGLHRVILFHMHNGTYYPSLAEHSSAEVVASVYNVLAYGSLELLSFVMALIVLKRALGFSSLRQLVFVLKMQAGMVQVKLTVVFFYIMQVSLAHLGADLSFKFAWLHNYNKIRTTFED